MRRPVLAGQEEVGRFLAGAPFRLPRGRGLFLPWDIGMLFSWSRRHLSDSILISFFFVAGDKLKFLFDMFGHL